MISNWRRAIAGRGRRTRLEVKPRPSRRNAFAPILIATRTVSPPDGQRMNPGGLSGVYLYGLPVGASWQSRGICLLVCHRKAPAAQQHRRTDTGRPTQASGFPTGVAFKARYCPGLIFMSGMQPAFALAQGAGLEWRRAADGDQGLQHGAA